LDRATCTVHSISEQASQEENNMPILRISLGFTV
jgi:hypothetical protein